MSETVNTHPVVGVMVCIVRNGGGAGPQVLLGERLGDRGHGCLAPVCGKIELGEPVRHAVLREVGEEVGLHERHIIGEPYLFGYTEVIDTVHHFTGLVFVAYVEPEWYPVNMEPTKHRAWGWFTHQQVSRIALESLYGGIYTADVCLEVVAPSQIKVP